MTTQNPMSLGLDYARGLATVGNQIQQRNVSMQNQGIVEQQNQAVQRQAEQEQANQLAQQQRTAEFNQLSQQYAQDPTNKELGLKMILNNPELGKQVQTYLGLNKDNTKKVTNKAFAFNTMLANNPAGAMEYYTTYLADDPAFKDMADEMAAGDYEGAQQELKMTIAAMGQDAYEKMFGAKPNFEGTGMNAQVANILLDPNAKGTPAWDLAKSYWTAPEITTMPDGSSVVVRKTLPDSLLGTPLGDQITTESNANANELSNDSNLPIQADDTGLAITEIAPPKKKITPEQKTYDEEFLGLTNMHDTLNVYKETLNRLGIQLSMGPVNAKDTQKLKSAYSNAMLAVKEAVELGALSGPDMGIIEQNLPDPTSWGGAFKGKDAAMEGVAAALNTVSRKASNLNEIYKDYELDLKELEQVDAVKPLDASALDLYRQFSANPPSGLTKEQVDTMFVERYGRLPSEGEL